MEKCSTLCPIIYSEKEFFVGINVGMWEALPGSIYENKWWKGVCVQFICAVEVRRGNPYFLKSEATRKCKDFHEGPGTECKERGGGGAVCRER